MIEAVDYFAKCSSKVVEYIFDFRLYVPVNSYGHVETSAPILWAGLLPDIEMI